VLLCYVRFSGLRRSLHQAEERKKKKGNIAPTAEQALINAKEGRVERGIARSFLGANIESSERPTTTKPVHQCDKNVLERSGTFHCDAMRMRRWMA
jgi:hypothetical protein